MHIYLIHINSDQEKYSLLLRYLGNIDNVHELDKYTVLSNIIFWSYIGANSIFFSYEHCRSIILLKLVRFIRSNNEVKYLNYSKKGNVLSLAFSYSKIKFASKKLIPENATIFLLKNLLENITYIDCYGDKSFMILADADFSPIAIVEKKLDTYAQQTIQHKLLKEKKVILQDTKPKFAEIPILEKIFSELLILKCINIWDLLAYGYVQDIFKSNFIYSFADYIIQHNLTAEHKKIAQEITQSPKNTSARIRELKKRKIQHGQLSREELDLFDDVLVYLKMIAHLVEKGLLIESETIKIDTITVYKKIDELKCVNIWELLCFGFEHELFDAQFIIDYAIHLLIENLSVNDQFVLDLAGLTNYETHKVKDLIAKKVKLMNVDLHDKEVLFNMLCYYIENVNYLINRQII